MKKILLLLLFITSFSFCIEITPQLIDAAKKQYGVTDAQIEKLAEEYVGQEKTDSSTKNVVTKKKVEKKPEEKSEDKKEKSSDKMSSFVSAKFPSELKQYGYDVFNQVAMTFTPLRNIPVARDYILGPGDELKIYLWGNIQQNFTAIVDSQGNIELPKVGRITVSNLSLDRASKLIETQMSRNFANFTLEVTLGQLKTVPVFVLGAVETPGKYNVDSLSTVLHVLYASGGPTTKGSLRNIRVIRDNRTIRTVDLYDLLLYGDNSADVTLRPGDIVYVSNIGAVAAINGAVKNPAIFEIRDSNSLSDLIKMAGEYTRNSYIKDINVIRKNEDSGKFELKTFSFPSYRDFVNQSKKIQIEDGDIINVISLSDELREWVEIKGSVIRPGMYSTDKVKNLAQLIKQAGGLSEKAFDQKLNIYRLTSSNQYVVVGVLLAGNKLEEVSIKEYDKVMVYSNEERRQTFKVSISGEVNTPIKQDYFEGITIMDLLFLANGYTAFADKKNVQILRKLTKDEKKVIELKDIDDKVLDTKLEPYDEVFIRKAAEFDYYGSVTLKGRVLYPGIYPLYKEETFTQLIERAGGLRQDAFVSGIKFYRDLEDKISEGSSGKVESADNSIKVADELVDINRLKVNFKEIIDRKEDKTFLENNNIILRDGDIIDVPLIPQEIRVVGGVYNAGSFIYKNNDSMSHYLNQAGNFRKDADAGEVYVVKADGTVRRTNDGGYTIDRGDTIVVPTKKYEEVDYLKTLLDWTQAIFNVATTWAVIYK